MRRIIHALAALTLVAGLGTAVGVATAGPAGASCAPNPMHGDWYNIDANSRAMARVVVETCASVTTCSNGACSVAHGAGTYLTPYGKCTPTNCNWGRTLGQNMSDGWVRTIHNFGFKTSYVWVRTYQYYGLTYLRVWVNNDFTPADGRADYITDEWFLR
jgi:hypothetical protein